jgi:Asp-tRNA(Asn)/Glu-tRNA(Gln) amidotransferase A subunit family amidase
VTQDELAFTSAWELRERIARKEISSVEVTEPFLRRIEALNHRLNAYITVTADLAMEQARAADAAVRRRGRKGLLHGVPVAIKDLTDVKSVRTTRGSLLYKDYVAESDSILVARIRAAGAVFLGKTNTPEFGHIGTGENPLTEHCRNPWNLERTPGGSSSGAAVALAAGLCPIAHGSDGAGSIRIPSAFCGVYGIKPTQGRVARPYPVGWAWGPFTQNGPMARTVRDAALLLQVIAGPDDSDPTALREAPPDFVAAAATPDVKGLRIAWSPDLGYAAVDPEVRTVAERAALVFQELGAQVETPAFALDGQVALDILKVVWQSDYEAAYGGLLQKQGDVLTPTLRGMLEEAQRWPASRMSKALQLLEWHRFKMARLFDTYDLLLTPTLAVTAFPIGQLPTVVAGRPVDRVWGFTPFTYPFNLTGQPAASVPCGFSAEGLPIGLHIVGRNGDEAAVLRASAAYEQARPWAGRRPPVS